eukprot:gnl/TRDRNA2_/TRDRNA2_87761_c1_seq1.p1 gnl/TRDRNA2_/TRDRNA2_87761_c1~~gnl/TRDRNA2_/TRDRNA2_87761_c1_seq1.p1  ORF type:complete len:128 (-),score=24.52 gnl/TRDRNA2_/TRDRNA2_87761_c1_seq1:29-412(-)
MRALRDAARADPTLEPMLLSTRQLLHAGRHLAQRPGDVTEAVRRALSAYFRFLPPLTRETVNRLLKQAMNDSGVSIDLEDRKDSQERERKARIAEERGVRLKDLEGSAIAMRFAPDHQEAESIRWEL